MCILCGSSVDVIAFGLYADDVSKADLARALLQTICGNYMNIAHHVMHKDGIRDLYLAGSFAKPDVSRCMLAKEFEVYRGFHLYRPVCVGTYWT